MWLPSPAAQGPGLPTPGYWSPAPFARRSLSQAKGCRYCFPVCIFNQSASQGHTAHTQRTLAQPVRQGTAFSSTCIQDSHKTAAQAPKCPPPLWLVRAGGESTHTRSHPTLQVHKHTHVHRSLKYQHSCSVHLTPLPKRCFLPVPQISQSTTGPA